MTTLLMHYTYHSIFGAFLSFMQKYSMKSLLLSSQLGLRIKSLAHAPLTSRPLALGVLLVGCVLHEITSP